MTSQHMTATREIDLGRIIRDYSLLVFLFLMAMFLFLWECGAAALHSKYLPKISLIITTVARDLVVPLGAIQPPDSLPLSMHILLTVESWAIGFVIAAVLGITLGFLLGVSRTTYSVGINYANLLRALPCAVLWPLFVRTVASTYLSQLSLIVFGSTWPIMFATMRSVGDVPREVYDTSAFMQLNWFQRKFLIVQWSMPGVFSGLEIGGAVALLLTVTSEIFAPSEGGLGWYVLQGSTLTQGPLEMVRIYGGLIITALLGLSVNSLLAWLRRLFVPWEVLHKQSYRLTSQPPKDLSEDKVEILKSNMVTELLRDKFDGVHLKVLYQGVPYFLPEQTANLKSKQPFIELTQRDIILQSNEQTLLFARSWILMKALTKTEIEQIDKQERTIGEVVRGSEAGEEYVNFGYHVHNHDKISDVFKASGTIRLIERTRMIKLRKKPAILIQEYLRP